MSVTYDMAPQFLAASNLFIEEALQLESNCRNGMYTGEEEATAEVKHKGLVTAVILQCCAAMETSLYTVSVAGPGWHHGSNGVAVEDREYLKLFASDIDDKRGTIEKFNMVLNLLKLEPFDLGRNPGQDASLVVKLRNSLIHYKPKACAPFDPSEEEWVGKLRSYKLRLSPFPGAKAIYFPSAALSADLGRLSLNVTRAFLDEFFKRLGRGSPFN